ncbi:MAG: hypothetical protein [Enterobacter phage ENC16]|nr:MAG: hypothetical protein [Enterobacter phage ENC16]
MIKGQKVRYIETGLGCALHGNLTVGKVYPVTAAAGDALKSVPGEVGGGAGFEVEDDDGDYIYIARPVSGIWGDWEVVE